LHSSRALIGATPFTASCTTARRASDTAAFALQNARSVLFGSPAIAIDLFVCLSHHARSPLALWLLLQFSAAVAAAPRSRRRGLASIPTPSPQSTGCQAIARRVRAEPQFCDLACQIFQPRLLCFPCRGHSVTNLATRYRPSLRTAVSKMAQPRFSSDSACPLGIHQLHGDDSFSSAIPATPDVEAGAPCPETPVPRGLANPPIDEFDSLLDDSFPQPQPLPLPIAETPITFYEDQSHFDLFFADALPPANISLPTSTVVRTAHNLRLPSFDVLGIAAPHPDRIPLRSSHSFSSSALGVGPLSKPEDPLHALSPPLDRHPQADAAAKLVTTSPKAARAQVEHVLATFTPPSEQGTFNWGAIVTAIPAALGSPPSSDPGVSPSLNLTATATAPGQAPIIVPLTVEPSNAVRMATWVDEAKDIIRKQTRAR
jgi:hypothetical protein